MKSLRNIYSFEEFLNEAEMPKSGLEAPKNELTEDVENYMFFQNLKVLKENIDKLLTMDPTKVDSILKDGHDWAADHITVATENVDQVTKFLSNQ
jgi:hypothetical protein